MDIFSKFGEKILEILETILPGSEFLQILMFIFRIITALLFIGIIARCFYSMKRGRRPEDPVVVLEETGSQVKIPVLYWENSLGRERTCDIHIPDDTVSRDHAVLMRRESGWIITDTDSKSGTYLNQKKINGDTEVLPGDTISVGRTSFRLIRASDGTPEKKKRTISLSASSRPAGLLVHTQLVFLLISLQCCFAGDEPSATPLLFFLLLLSISCLFYLYARKILNRVSFELENLGLLLGGTSVLLMLGVSHRTALVQFAAMALGILLFSFMIAFMGNLERVTKYRIFFEITGILLFGATLVLGTEVHGAKNWIYIGSLSIQPSELVKVAFIFAGASTLNKLQTRKNLTEFLLFSAACVGFLVLMHDFGSAVIFFFTFLVISFMRSGSIRTIVLICAAAVFGLFIILKFKPYVAQRFAGWGHVWEDPYDLGYQQTRVLTYSASGGLFGIGPGKGYLKEIFAGESDLVFGRLCEELGWIFALAVIVVFMLLVFYTLSDVTRSRSTFYSITSCAAAGMMLFQACLNIFGSTDIFPLTGVTLPFISAGGSSMICVWGLLAFIKASDERTYAARRRKT